MIINDFFLNALHPSEYGDAASRACDQRATISEECDMDTSAVSYGGEHIGMTTNRGNIPTPGGGQLNHARHIRGVDCPAPTRG